MAPAADSPLDCWSRGGTARFEREGRWSHGRLYAAVKRWRGREPELVHRRDEHSLVLTLSGGTSLTGNKISGTPRYEGADRAGCVSFVPAGAERRGWYRGADMEFVALLIAPGFVDELAAGAGELPAFTNRRDPLLDAVLRGLAGEMRREADGGALPSAYAEHAAGLVMAHLARVAGLGSRRSPAVARALSPSAVALVTDFVEANLARDVSLSDLAAVAGMPLDAFAREFKATTGTPPYRFVLERRLDRARAWLRDGRMPLAAIALALGFSSQSHFTRAFRRYAGVAPGAYRRASA